jgi:hypothetical protein
MSQQSVRQGARRSALDARAVLGKERAHRDRRLEALAVEVLTALGERELSSGTLSGALGKRCGHRPCVQGVSGRDAVVNVQRDYVKAWMSDVGHEHSEPIPADLRRESNQTKSSNMEPRRAFKPFLHPARPTVLRIQFALA